MAMPPNPQVVPLVGPGGLVTREWLRYLQGLITAASAGDVQTLADAIAGLNSQFASLSADVAGLSDDIDAIDGASSDDQAPPFAALPIDDDHAPPSSSGELLAHMAELDKRIAALEQGYQI